MKDSRRVYSTEAGRIRPAAPSRSSAPAGPPLPNDGVVRVFRGLPGRQLEERASDLKRLCGAGGAVKDGAVEIQGDHREKIAERLRGLGHAVKLAGG